MATRAKRHKTVIDIKRQQVLKLRKKKLRLQLFKPKEKSISGRVCEFLFWAGQRHPKSIITYEEITQAIFSLGSKPTMANKLVKSAQSALSRARKSMKAKYRQDILTEKGVGARITIDDIDVLTTSVMRDAESHRRSVKKLQSTVSLINHKTLDQLIEEAPPDIKEDLEITRAWFKDSLLKLAKHYDKPGTEKALLPPVPDRDDG